MVKNVFRLSVDIWRSERDKNLCVCVCRVREPPPLVSGSHSLVWMVGIAVSFRRDSHTHTHIRECKNVYLSPSLSFDSRLKLTATRFHRPLPILFCPLSTPLHPLFFFWPRSHPDFPVMTSERVHGSVITNLKLVIWPEMALALRISADKGPISQPQLFVKS